MNESIYNNAGMPSEQEGSQMSDVPDWAKQFMPLDAAEKAAEMRQENELKQLAEKFSKLADMSEQGAAPEVPSPTVIYANISNQSEIERFTGQKVEQGAVLQLGPYVVKCDYDLAIKRIAALTLERDTLKAMHFAAEKEIDCALEVLGAAGDDRTLEVVVAEKLAALKAKVERLSAPVSDEEWTNVVVVSPQHDHRTWMERKQVNSIIAARASTPPVHPINDDEQRRKDAGWNDRPKARCVCGEMIAWYSGEWLHVAGRSRLCADGRLASPAHFLVGMPPAEPEWQKES